MKIEYEDHNFRAKSLALIGICNEVIEDYDAQGFTLTVRQLYYQLVARDHIPNHERSYKNIIALVRNARYAGLMSWSAIEDRTRSLRSNTHWNDPREIVRAAIDSYQVDRWANQRFRPEVFIEKDALVGVIEGICDELDVPYFSCRGYVSASEMWKAGCLRLDKHIGNDQDPIIIHLGDHDPSGLDMTRDIRERLALFAKSDIEIRRIALNMDQIEEYDPPPNPTKLSDARARGYVAHFGYDSWELDALEPTVMASLIRDEVESLIDDDAWKASGEQEKDGQDWLRNKIGDAAKSNGAS